MKEITLQIPEGKKAEWINGVLTLVDDKPRDITECIKTFDDACEELGEEHHYVKAYREWMRVSFAECKDVTAYLKLRIICAALNEGWRPTFDNQEIIYYPRFCISETGYAYYNYKALRTSSSSSFNLHARLALKTEELAVYCGRQFDDIWAKFLTK